MSPCYKPTFFTFFIITSIKLTLMLHLMASTDDQCQLPTAAPH